MEKITITEALSEINLIKKKISGKQEKIRGVLTRMEHAKDPYESEGGSAKMIECERQALNDLYIRFLKIRKAISKANMENDIIIGKNSLSIHDWLTWKRELSEIQRTFISDTHARVKSAMDKAHNSPQLIRDLHTNETLVVKVIANINYPEWVKEDEEINQTLEKLDGQLSLKNATIFIEI